jgi:hypothetical protein
VASRFLDLRRPDTCVACGSSLEAGSRAWWNADQKTVTCVSCTQREGGTVPGLARPIVPSEPRGLEGADDGLSGLAPLERGRPGRSLGEEHERRRAKREEIMRTAHPRIGSFLLSLQGEPQHEAAFRQGKAGEERVGNLLDERTCDGPTVILHNRRMPRGRGDIDHIAISPNGLYVIDTKALTGKVAVRKPLFGSPKLIIGGRDKTNLLDGLERQITAVKIALANTGYDDTPLKGVLCFTRADLPLLGAPRIRGHQLMYRKSLARKLNRSGPVSAPDIEQIARSVAAALPAA